MTDGREIVADYLDRAEAIRPMSKAGTRPLALASADFDKDGVADLACGYSEPAGGLVVVLRGNIDSIYPNTPEADERRRRGEFTDSPFLTPARSFDIAAAPDFIQAGDFNADGNLDLAAASRGESAIQLLAGDGAGSFRDVEAIVLPGLVTAMAAGEINRADGLADLAVAITNGTTNELMVFEGPLGALESRPETFALSSQAPALTVGHLDDDHFGDVAVAAGNELMVAHGRDRRLFLPESERQDVEAATVSRRAFSRALKSLAVGDFTGDLRLELAALLEDGAVEIVSHEERAQAGAARAEDRWRAETLHAGGEMTDGFLLCTRVASLTHDTLVAFEPAQSELRLWTDRAERIERGDDLVAANEGGPTIMKVDSAPVAVLPMRLNKDALSDLVVLRQESFAPTVLLTQAIQSICVTNTGDCNSCGSLRDAINAANSSPGLDEIVFDPSLSGTPTINLTLGSLPQVTGAITLDGTAICGNQDTISPQRAFRIRLNRGNSSVTNAVNIQQNGSGSVVSNFVISNFGSGTGVQLNNNSGNFVEGNLIGTDATGNFSNQNAIGVRINNARNNTVGGTASPALNIISGNIQGLEIAGSNSVDNVVRLNRIGITGGQLPNLLGNIQSGINITGGASRNVIGGPLQSGLLLNVIADNQDGIVIASGTANLAQSNQIDLNRRNGVTINSTGNTIGGPVTATNGIWRNRNNGVEVNGNVQNNLVQGNFIGINFDGPNILDRGNEGDGVLITNSAVRNFVGGPTQGAGNIIALNRRNGVTVTGASTVQNSIVANRLSANGLLDIDLGNDGRTNNDDRDLDAGANDLQNFPVLTAAIFSPTSAGEITPAAPGLTITVNFNSTPSQTFSLDFFFGGDCECRGPQCISSIPVFLGSRNATTDATGNFTGSFTFDFVVPAAGGFVNASATSPTGSTSELSQCIAVGTQNQCTPICTANQTAVATSAAGAVVNYTQATLPGGCAGVTVSCAPPSGSTFAIGTTAVTCTAREGATVRGTCSFNVTVNAPAGPTITNVTRSGKKLFVTGTGFVDGAQLFLNGSRQKKVTINSSTDLVSKKAGKNVIPGDNQVVVVNPDGGTSNTHIYNQP
jgi:hypothetical protein